jgi:hypothetical protein
MSKNTKKLLNEVKALRIIPEVDEPVPLCALNPQAPKYMVSAEDETSIVLREVRPFARAPNSSQIMVNPEYAACTHELILFRHTDNSFSIGIGKVK